MVLIEQCSLGSGGGAWGWGIGGGTWGVGHGMGYRGWGTGVGPGGGAFVQTQLRGVKWRNQSVCVHGYFKSEK